MSVEIYHRVFAEKLAHADPEGFILHLFKKIGIGLFLKRIVWVGFGQE